MKILKKYNFGTALTFSLATFAFGVSTSHASPIIESQVIPRWNCSALPNTDSATSVVISLHTGTKNPKRIPGYIEVFTGDNSTLFESGVLVSSGHRFDSETHRLVIDPNDSSQSYLYEIKKVKKGNKVQKKLKLIEHLNCAGVFQGG